MKQVPKMSKNKTTLTYGEFVKVMRLRTGLSEKTINKLYEAMVDFIIEELKVNGKVYLKWLGYFYTYWTDGVVKNVPNREGGTIRRYCAPKRKVEFKTTETFRDNLNSAIGNNTLRDAQDTYKKGELIEAGSALQDERDRYVQNLIFKEAEESRKKAKETNYLDLEDGEDELDELIYGGME